MSKHNPPTALQDAGKALWSEVVGAYELRSDERVVLERACKTADRLALVEREWIAQGQPFLTKGSMGQEVMHPLFSEQQKLEAHQASLLARLKLPDDSSGAAANQNRDAANASWQPGVRGRGA